MAAVRAHRQCVQRPHRTGPERRRARNRSLCRGQGRLLGWAGTWQSPGIAIPGPCHDLQEHPDRQSRRDRHPHRARRRRSRDATVAVYSEDDARSLHCRAADQAMALGRGGARPISTSRASIACAQAAGCDAIHPGYGFLSENAEFATACAKAGLTFIGPSPQVLSIVRRQGPGARAGANAAACRLLAGTEGPRRWRSMRTFFVGLARTRPIMIKAIAGGGGRGMRIGAHGRGTRRRLRPLPVRSAGGVRQRCRLRRAFMPKARHIEMQVLGDGNRRADHLGERDCTLQRRHQKIVESRPRRIWPGPARALCDAARVACATTSRYAASGHSNFWSTRPARAAAFVVHRGQSAAAGRAYGDRGGDRHRSGRSADRRRPRRDAGGNRTEAGRHTRAARLCRAVAREHGEDGRRRNDQAHRAERYVVSCRRRARACASIRSATPAIRRNPGYDPLLAKVIVHAHPTSPRRWRGRDAHWRNS